MHRIVVERLFTLGDFKNIKIIVEASAIPEKVWSDPRRLAQVREDLQAEILANYSLHLMTVDANSELIRDRNFAEIYTRTSGLTKKEENKEDAS